MIHPVVFGKFILLERVSVGGMAEVYRAKLLNAPGFERFFAIKRILPHLAADTDFVTMFINEAKVAVELEHPNVCQIYELGRLGQSHYIAMEFIAGRDVLAIQSHYRRQRKIMSVSQACFIIAQAAQGLDYAHKAVDSTGNPLGLVHRDVSPQNLIVAYDGVVKLIDFGVSKASRRASNSQSGVVKGKFSYMSPEQAADKDIDHRSDIFALGVVFWELLTGRRLFQSESEFAILDMIQNAPIEKPSKYNRMIPESVDKICMKALERDITKRYQWAAEMVIDLFDFINSCKTPFTQWHLQTWMCTTFKDTYDREWELLPIFKTINTVEDIDKYNAEHADASIASEDVRTQDIGVLDPSLLADDKPTEEEKPKAEVRYAEPTAGKSHRSVPIVGASGSGARKLDSLASKLPPVPGRATKTVGETSKPMPGVKPVSLPGLKPATKDGDNSGPRLEICVSDVNSDEDIELEPEGIDPEETPSVLVKLQQAERKARTRKGLVGLIVAICVMLIACPVLLVTGVVELPKPVPNLPTSATVQFTVVPDSAQAVVKIYPKNANPNDPNLPQQKGANPVFDNLQAGDYLVDVSMPDYENETFALSLANGTSESRLEMTRPILKKVKYSVNISPDDAMLYVNGKRQAGVGSPRMLEGIVGRSYQLRVSRAGYESVEKSIDVVQAMKSIDVELDGNAQIDVHIDSDPSGAMVYLVQDGKNIRKGETPLDISGIDSSKKTTIELKKSNYQTWKYDLDFNEIETSNVKLFGALEPTS